MGLGTVTSMLNTGKNGKKELIPSASAASSDGSWSLGPNTLSVAIHAALLKSGKILYVAGSGDNPANAAGPFKAALLDPKTQDQTEIILSEDISFAVATASLKMAISFLQAAQKRTNFITWRDCFRVFPARTYLMQIKSHLQKSHQWLMADGTRRWLPSETPACLPIPD
jgi:hypothetical protein